MTLIENFGLIEKDYKPSDDFFGGVSRILNDEVKAKNGQWDIFLPSEEWQIGVWTPTRACTAFSSTSALEFEFNRWINDLKWRMDMGKYYLLEEVKALKFLEDNGYFDGEDSVNFSDRFTAKMSGTTIRGNSFGKVAHSIRWDGLVPEKDWPFDRSREGKVTWNEYYKEIPQWVKDKGKKFLDYFEINYEFLSASMIVMMPALRYATLVISMKYNNKEDADGIIHYVGYGALHAMVLYGYEKDEYRKVFDSISKTKKKYSWDYPFRAALKYNLRIKINNPMLKLKNNTLIQDAEQTGAFGLYLDGRILVGEPAEVIATFIMRSGGDLKGMVKPVKKDDWRSVPHYDIKDPDRLIYKPK